MSKIPLDDDSFEKILSSFDNMIESRGQPDSELDQYYVTKETSLQRALLVEPESYKDKRIVFFGDMDLVSFNIGMLSKTRDLAVLDIDKRIPEIIFKMKFEYKIHSIRYVNQDIRIRMIAVLKNQFDYIFTEPSMTEEGLELAL
ncbi:MAG: bis-aminopropyl spermidine synthase family protein [Candidatus Heimdallarchaeaceae archaeon]|jgi:predicted methyltransferase